MILLQTKIIIYFSGSTNLLYTNVNKHSFFQCKTHQSMKTSFTHDIFWQVYQSKCLQLVCKQIWILICFCKISSLIKPVRDSWHCCGFSIIYRFIYSTTVTFEKYRKITVTPDLTLQMIIILCLMAVCPWFISKGQIGYKIFLLQRWSKPLFLFLVPMTHSSLASSSILRAATETLKPSLSPKSCWKTA